MADGGPPALQPHPAIPPVVSPTPYVQLPAPPAQPNLPASMPQLNWSHVKPQFANKPEKDADRLLQDQFRQQPLKSKMSKIGKAREQLFHVWRSFHFNKNTETLDTYVTCIRQVEVLLVYGKPKILELFKNTLTNRLYWVLFP